MASAHACGSGKTVSAWCSDSKTTMNVCTHVNLDAKRQAADVLDHALTE